MSTTQKAGNAGEQPGVVSRATQFLRESRTELRKVTWPSRQELIVYTIVVIVTVIVVGVFIGAVDFVLSRLLAFLS